MGLPRSTALVRGLAILALFVMALLPAGAYFAVQAANCAQRLTQDAQAQAHLVSQVVAAYPIHWRDVGEWFATAIDGVRDRHNQTTVTDRAGATLLVLGEVAGPWRIARQAPFHDFGVEAGQVVVSESLQDVVLISTLLALAGLLLSWALLTLLRDKVFAVIDRAEHHLRQANAELAIAAATFEAQEGIFITDASGTILRVNRAFTDITGYTADEAVGQNPRFLSSGRHDAAFYAAMWESIGRSGGWHGEIWDRRKNGEIYPEWLTITAVKAQQGAVSHYVGTMTDITARKVAEEEIRRLAFLDPLTRLPNRRLLQDRLQQALLASARSKHHGALLFLDLDKFKGLNDTLGHAMGDLLLQQIAQQLLACVREGDTVARLGGDEFVVLLADLSETAPAAASQTQIVGEKILAAVNQTYQLGGHDYRSSASIGITLFCGQQETAEELLKRADRALYSAKAAGRNRLRFFESTMPAA